MQQTPTPSQHRSALVTRSKRIIVKLGSAVLTTNAGLDLVAIHWLSDQVIALQDRGCEVILVSSGAVAAGRKRLSHPIQRTSIPHKQAAAALGQSLLMRAWEQGLGKHGRHAAQILLTAEDLSHHHRYLNARHTIETLLEWGVVPIINENDSVAVDEIKFGDNDQLAAHVAGLLGADLVILLTDTDGLYDKNPHEHSDATLISQVDQIDETVLSYIATTKSDVGTGGMMSKVEAARKSMASGIPLLIAAGKERDILPKLLDGANLGTLFVPPKRFYQGKKRWLALLSRPAGTLRLDAGATRALIHKGGSLLPIGITEVEGHFEAGATVQCISQDGQSIGMGLTNYSAPDIRQIMGHRSQDIEARLGFHHSDEVIHRNYFALADSLDTPEKTDTEPPNPRPQETQA